MASFHCQKCGMDCCTCSGCQPMTTDAGTQCCSRCYVGVNRMEVNNKWIQEQAARDIQVQNRPNERLYING